MFMFTRVVVISTCLVMAACAGAVPPGRTGTADDVKDAQSSGIAGRDRPVQATGNSAPQISVKHDPRLGSVSAKIGIIEFSDYQCAYCRDFHRKQFAQIKKEYIDTGVVQFIHKDLPLRYHAQAVPAAMAAHCAGAQGRFWDMHDALFDQQARLSLKLYPELARLLNLDEPKFSACFAGQDHNKGIGQDIGVARRLGLSATPSFLIGTIEGDILTVTGQSRGAPGYEVFVREIEKLRQPAVVPPR